MRATLTSIPIMALLAALALQACSDDDAADSGTPDGGDTDTDISGYDCRFTMDGAPFDIRTVTSGHVAFPDVTRLPSDDILLVYREASIHGVDSTAKITRQVGSADGLTWSDPVTLHDEPGVDDRDPSVTTLAGGDVVLNYFQYVYQATAADGNMPVHQIFFGRSTDEGETWGDFTQVSSGDGYAMEYTDPGIADDYLWKEADGTPVMLSACSNKVVEIDGELVVQSYGGYAWNSSYAASPRSTITLYRSTDGASWTEDPVVPGSDADNNWLQEPALLDLGGGELLLHLRNAVGSSPGNTGNMLQLRSSDGGETWSELSEFDFIGHAPFLYELSNGVIVSAFRWINSTYTSTNVSFVYSTDRGETWSELIDVLDPLTVETGYPSILELDGDKMLIVYYVGGTTISAAIYDFALVEKS